MGANRITFGTIFADIYYKYEGREVSQDLLLQIAQDHDTDLQELRNAISVHVAEYRIYTREDGIRPFPNFQELLRYMWEKRIKYLFTYDSVRLFSWLEWEIHNDTAHEWRYVKKDDQIDENRHYTKVDGWAWTALVGELGQCYKMQIWTKQRGKGKKSDRHLFTRGFSIYGFKNIFNKGLEQTFKSLGAVGEIEVDKLYSAIDEFSKRCESLVGEPFIGSSKPLAMTAGGLAKRDLLNCLYHMNYPNAVKKFRKDHPLTAKQYKFFSDNRLMRGGICYANAKYEGRKIEVPEGRKIHKYDVTSLYSRAAWDMPDLTGKPHIVHVKEMFERKPGYTYIINFRFLEMRLKKGMPAIFTHPFTGKNSKLVRVTYKFSIFAEELDELANFYNIGECDVHSVLRIKNSFNQGYRDYINKYFPLKQKARAEGDKGTETFAKLMNVSAWGKLSQRKEYPDCWHEYNPQTGLIELKKRELTPEEKEAEGGSLSIVQGAYITALGRIYEMRYIREICGEKNVTDTFIYADTDSIITFAEAPEELIKPNELGMLKDEFQAVEMKVLCKKVYYMIASYSPFVVDLHAKGIPKQSILDKILYSYGADSLAECPPDVFSAAFSEGEEYIVPASMNATGGRADMFIYRQIQRTGKKIKTQDFELITDINGEFMEK